MSSETKISLRIGEIEVSYEGDHGFVEDGLWHLLERAVALSNEHVEPGVSPTAQAAPSASSTNPDLSVMTIASRLRVKTGPELAVAAAARLSVIEGRAAFSRSDLMATMKEATGHYKSSMGSNLSATLRGLVRNNRLNENGSGMYALTAKEKETLETSLAQ